MNQFLKKKSKKRSRKVKKEKNDSFLIYSILTIIALIAYFNLIDEVQIIRLENINFWWFFLIWSVITVPITLYYHLKKVNKLNLTNTIIGIIFACIISIGLSSGSQIPLDNLSKAYSKNNPIQNFDLKITSVNYRKGGANLWYNFKNTQQVIRSSEKKWLNNFSKKNIRLKLSVKRGLATDYIIENFKIYEEP